MLVLVIYGPIAQKKFYAHTDSKQLEGTLGLTFPDFDLASKRNEKFG